MLPAAIVPTLSFPGLAFAALMKSPSVCIGLTVHHEHKIKSAGHGDHRKIFRGIERRLWNVATLVAAAFVIHAIGKPSGGAEITARCGGNATRPWHVFDHDALVEFLAQPVSQNARGDIRNTTAPNGSTILIGFFRPRCLQ